MVASCLAGATPALRDPIAAGTTLRVLSTDLLEVEIVADIRPGTEGARPWNFVLPASAVVIPDVARFAVTIDGRAAAVTGVGLKRRALWAPLGGQELRAGTWLYLRLERDVPAGATVVVTNPDGTVFKAEPKLQAVADGLRENPAIHVNQVGYLPAETKRAMVGYYLGTMGEMPVPAASGFRIVDLQGTTVYEGRLRMRPERGYTYSPAPYLQVWEADFSALRTPGEYRLAVPGLGASLPFRIDDGAAMAFTRAYALGIYHQRCGTTNALPFTRFVHGECHVTPAQVPSPEAEFPSTWRTLAATAKEDGAPGNGPVLDSERAQLYPFVHKGTVAIPGGHHDAGDYGKYTTNSASFIHCLLFAVDVLPGGECDNLGLPESGDGVPDLLQEAKWEADFLARMQDDDGGFYFLVSPRDRAYEGDVLPDQGDPQVVWPKNTAATAAAVAALAQAGSSPHLRRAFPQEAADYLARAKKGWQFLQAALERYGPQGSYQRLTHYGDNFRHDDELAWAAAELFLATGEEAYHQKFKQWCNPASDQTRRWGWWRMSECWGHAIRSYAFAARCGRIDGAKLDPALRAKCEAEIEAAGRDALRNSDESAYGTSFPAETKRMRGGGWYFSLDQAFDLAVASQLDYPRKNDPRPEFLEAYLANLNYEAGTNPVNMSYVTGLGQRRPREVVHQFAENDRRLFPPTGLPLGNLTAGQPYLEPYRGELGGLSLPEDGAASGPYPYYDRWTDTHNVSAEFVIVNQARALAGLVWLASRTETARQRWRAAEGKVTGLPDKIAVGKSATARLVVPAGLDLTQAAVTWEAAGGQSGRGETFTFTPGAHGRQWVEAEAEWPDGRRVFAASELDADNGRAVVTITAPQTTASAAKGTQAVFRFQRTGKTAAPLTVHFALGGSATKWNDYRRPEGDMPVDIVIPAGSESVDMAIRAIPGEIGNEVRDVRVTVKPDDAYNVGTPREAKATVSAK